MIDLNIHFFQQNKQFNFKKKISYIFATLCGRPALIFQTINSVRSNNFSLKYQRFTQSGCKDIESKQFECVTNTQVIYTFKHSVISLKLVLSHFKGGARINQGT